MNMIISDWGFKEIGVKVVKSWIVNRPICVRYNDRQNMILLLYLW